MSNLGYAPFEVGERPKAYDLHEAHFPTPAGSVRLVRTQVTASRVTLFVHGLNGSWRSWMPTLRALHELGHAVGDVAVVDFTHLRLPRRVTDMDQVSTHLSRYLVSEGWTSVDLVGHSTGGSLAAYMATAAPTCKVLSLRLISGLYVQLFEEARRPLLRTDRQDTTSRTLAKLKIAGRLGPVVQPGMRLLSHRPGAVRSVGGGLYAHPDQLPPTVLQALARSFDARALRDTLAIGRRYFPREIYPAIHVPTRLAFGERDPLTGEADACVAHQLIPHLDWHRIPNAGHFAHIEQPVATAAHLWDLMLPV